MFVDEDLDPIEFKSLWKKEKKVFSSEVQTRDLETHDVSAQAIKRKHREIQTDEDIEEDIQLYEDNSPELIDFIQRAGPLMLSEMQKIRRSHAFDGYKMSWRGDNKTVTKEHTLCHTQLTEELEITGLSWNSTGSVIAACYGRFDHEDWCTHKSSLCTWNLDRRNLDTNKPDASVDVPCCLMCIACHPFKPSIVAGGTFNGEVMVWDTSRHDDMLIATSGIGDDSHREPVSKLHWVKDTTAKGARYNIVSVSSDGKILVWQINSKKQKLTLTDGFILLTESLPRELRARARRGDQEMGVTCLSYSPHDESSFLIGSESGGIFKCSSNKRGTPASRDIISSVPLASPVTFCFSPHNGPVYSVDCSKYHRNLFVSCGSDKTARIYSMLQNSPLMTLEPGAGYLYGAQWSPVRPLVFAVATESGALLLYDLRLSQTTPAQKLDVSKHAVYNVKFNPHQPRLLATGDSAGHIHIWNLSDDFIKPANNETDLLEEIAGTVMDT